MGIELGQSVLLILAGGKSERFGEVKGLKPVDGEPLIAWQIARFQSAGGGKVVVVLGHHVVAYKRALVAGSAECVVNEEPQRGPFSSLQCGLGVAAPGPTGAIFVLPVDVPAASAQVWRMLAQCDRQLDAVIPTHEGRGGHPVRLGADFAAQLREIPWDRPDARLDAQLAALPPTRLRRLEVEDESIRLNLNTPAAFQKWESSLDNSPAAHNS